MAEEQQGQERTEQPTAKRLTEARKKGQVARSRELNTLLVMLASAVALAQSAPKPMLNSLRSVRMASAACSTAAPVASARPSTARLVVSRCR